ncbi:MAG: hypothetical protein PUD39_09055 [Bacteroidales bacterium]|nr:hypothetical protein [Bacteroidales bacterium]
MTSSSMYLLVILLIFAIAILAISIVVINKKMKGHSDPQRYALKVIGFGSLDAFLPMALWSFIEKIELHSGNGMIQHIIGFLFMGIGACIMAKGFYILYKLNKDNANIRKSGFMLAIIGSMLCCYHSFQIVFLDYFSGADILLDFILFAITSVIMALACFKLSRYYTRFRGAGVAFSIMSFIFLIMPFAESYVYEYNELLSLILDCIYGAGLGVFIVLLTMIVLCLRIAWAKPKAIIANAPTKLSSGHNVDEKSTEHSGNTTDDILQKMMGYDDAKLRKIVDKPDFHCKEVVEKAHELLARREAWEKIKDLPDAELLEMTMADKGLYELNIVEAASMELYQRESQLLREQFKALTPDTVAAIASGTAPAPEGIRLAANRYLNGNQK